MSSPVLRKNCKAYEKKKKLSAIFWHAVLCIVMPYITQTVLQKKPPKKPKEDMGKLPAYSTVLSKSCEISRNSKIRNKQECSKRCLSASK